MDPVFRRNGRSTAGQRGRNFRMAKEAGTGKETPCRSWIIIIAQLPEDYVLGKLSRDRYQKMSRTTKRRSRNRLKLEIEVIEEWVEQRKK